MLKPISWIYDHISQARSWAYQNQVLHSVKLKTPVISVGNLSMGGTGKTPVIDLILKDFESRGIRVGVVSRAYKALSVKPTKVNFSEPQASLKFGDEPLWIAKNHPLSPVYVGVSKSENALEIQRKEDVQVILIDDGFQHLRLYRNLNLVLLDLSQTLEHFRVFPSGGLRESITALDRADFILFTKAQFENSTLRDWLEKNSIFKKPHALLKQSFKAMKAGPGKYAGADFQKVQRCLVVCGIARPESFLKLLETTFTQVQFQLYSLANHKNYQTGDLNRIEEVRQKSGCDAIITTEKDSVKLDLFENPFACPWFIAPLEMSFVKGEKDFYECLHKVLR